MDIGTDEGDIVQTPLVKDKITHCVWKVRGRRYILAYIKPNFHHRSFSQWMESLFVLYWYHLQVRCSHTPQVYFICIYPNIIILFLDITHIYIGSLEALSRP